MKLYPYDLPPGVHPDSWWLLGFGLQPEQVSRLVKHLTEELGVRLDLTPSQEKTYRWVVGVAGDYPEHNRAEVGDGVDITVSATQAVRVTGGAPPPGVRLEKRTGRLVGRLTHPGLYSVTVTTGPAVKYDPLGTPGGPGDPGIWIPVDQRRQQPPNALEEYPATLADLDDRDKDRALAELLAWRDNKKVEEAD